MPFVLRLHDGKTLTFLSISDVEKRLPSLNRATIHRWTQRGRFPPAQKMTDGLTSPLMWREADVDKWIEEHAMLEEQ